MESFTMDDIIKEVVSKLGNQVQAVYAIEVLTAEKQPDRDHNHYIDVEITTGEKRPASFFALNLNGNPKDFETCVKELEEKIKQFLRYKDDPSKVHLASGVWIDPAGAEDIPIEVIDHHLVIDGKIAVAKQDETYIPLLDKHLHSYTSSVVKLEGPLLIITDEHQQVRDDGKEGFIFNLEAPLHLKKSQMSFYPEDNPQNFPGEGEYLLLYRKCSEAKTS